MTGIERLYKLSEDVGYTSLWSALLSGREDDWDCEEYDDKTLDGTLTAIADQIQREQESLVADSPYDAIPPEDRDAIAWVREHGGLEAVKASIHQGAMEHGCLLKVAETLGTSIYDGAGNADALLDKLEKRLMPEGCEWPTVDGEPVVIGERMRSCGIDDCKVVGIDPANSRLTLASDDIEEGKATYFTDSAEYCHRPIPKVYDADGVEIRKGDVLYRKSDGYMVEVAEVYEKTFIDADDYIRPGDGFTHRAPVLAADGRPLREGEHVYHVETGAELVVKGLPKPGEYQAVVVFALPTSPASHLTSFDPDQLTHQRPVLDADGVPIKVGDTVYLLHGEWCGEFPCLGFHGGEELEVFADGEAAHVSGSVQCREKGASHRYTCYPQPSQLTHIKPEPPDSLERIADEIDRLREDVAQYLGDYLYDEDGNDSIQFSMELVAKRCRALAERERGE